jgi:hypothetical protein
MKGFGDEFAERERLLMIAEVASKALRAILVARVLETWGHF